MEANRKQRIDHALCKFFFGCSISFLAVESEFFKEFVRCLDPGYSPPSRKTLSTTLLDNFYDWIIQDIKEDEVKDSVMSIDGWKCEPANTKNVVSMVRTTSGKSMFLEAWDFSRIKETGGALAVFANQCKNLGMERYNVNIYAAVTDNASNMNSMGEQLENIWHTTCHSHSGDLLFKKLVNKSFNIKVNLLVKEFKSSWLEAELVERTGKKMIQSAKTRWCSVRNKYERCYSSLDAMRDIYTHNQTLPEDGRYEFKPEVVNLLFDDEFKEKLDLSISILDPVCKLVNACQKSNCSIAYAVEYWFALKLPVYNHRFELALAERLEKVINQFGLAANFLCHLYKGRKFINNNQHIDTMNLFFEHNLSAQGKVQLDAYINQTGWFEVLFNQGYTSWRVFWRNARRHYPELSKLAVRLLSIPAASANIERLFSQWAIVHNKLRNKLKFQRSAKLAAIYFALRSVFVNNNEMLDVIPIVHINQNVQLPYEENEEDEYDGEEEENEDEEEDSEDEQ